MATAKQVEYCLTLLGRAGYDTRFMGAAYKALGATMRERSGSVRAWLEGKNGHEVNALIDRLKKRGEA